MSEQQRAVRGRLTRCDLSKADVFFAPWQADPWGSVRPSFQPALARLSAELSGDIYDLDVERWLDAGWGDCTLQVEKRVFGSMGDWRRGGIRPGRALQNQLTLYRARAMISPMRNPVGDVLRAVRQINVTDTGKAMVMARKIAAERYVVAICFMGTSRKFYDWVTNFKLTSEQGLHAGFLHLARQFDGNAERIIFPDLQEELGLQSLTLEDILNEAQRKDSRFLLWVTGHSQGGAVCQTYLHTLLRERGVLPQNVVSYTFAAPTVAGPDWKDVPASYPIYNILNADDFVPRVGASMRLGVDLTYYPDDTFRMEHYEYANRDEKHMNARARLHRILDPLQDTATMLEMLLGMCVTLRQMDDIDTAQEILASMHVVLRYLPSAMTSLGIRLEDINKLLIDKLSDAYRSVAGKNPDPVRVQMRSDAIAQTIAELGPQMFTTCLGEVLYAPHVIAGRFDRTGALRSPYCAIVRWHPRELVWAVWHAEGAPHQLVDEGTPLLP